MFKLLILAIIFFLLPSGMVSAYYLSKYLSYRLRLLEDKRRRDSLREDIKDLLE